MQKPEKPKKPIPRAEKPAASSAPMVTASSAPPSERTTNPRDLERSRAKDAWEKIESVKPKPQTYQAEYGRLARKMPTFIQVNGLAQTLAFLKAKGKEHHTEMFQHLSTWVCSRPIPGKGNLLDRALEMDSQSYRLATSEALAFLQWLKRFAEAELGSEEES